MTYEDNEFFILNTELLIDNDVIEHYNKTDSEALTVKSFIIFKYFPLWLCYYFAFCFKTFNIANCKMSPIYSTD